MAGYHKAGSLSRASSTGSLYAQVLYVEFTKPRKFQGHIIILKTAHENLNSEAVLRFVVRKAETEFVLIIFFREAVLPIQRARLTTRTLTVTGKKSRKFYLLKLDASL